MGWPQQRFDSSNKLQPCSVHGKMRTLMSLQQDGMGGFKCTPGQECKTGSRDGSSGGAATDQSEGARCSVHGKQRSYDCLVEDGSGGYCCAEGRECKLTGAGFGGRPKTPCKFYAEGKCAKGAQCTFLHEGAGGGGDGWGWDSWGGGGKQSWGGDSWGGSGGGDSWGGGGGDSWGGEKGSKGGGGDSWGGDGGDGSFGGAESSSGCADDSWGGAKGSQDSGKNSDMGCKGCGGCDSWSGDPWGGSGGGWDDWWDPTGGAWDQMMMQMMMASFMGKMGKDGKGKGKDGGKLGKGKDGSNSGKDNGKFGKDSGKGKGKSGGGYGTDTAVCAKHGKTRSLRSLYQLPDGSMCCMEGQECKMAGDGDGTKRTMCKFFLEGGCTRGASCTFAHDPSELGQPVPADQQGGGFGYAPY